VGGWPILPKHLNERFRIFGCRTLAAGEGARLQLHESAAVSLHCQPERIHDGNSAEGRRDRNTTSKSAPLACGESAAPGSANATAKGQATSAATSAVVLSVCTERRAHTHATKTIVQHKRVGHPPGGLSGATRGVGLRGANVCAVSYFGFRSNVAQRHGENSCAMGQIWSRTSASCTKSGETCTDCDGQVRYRFLNRAAAQFIRRTDSVGSKGWRCSAIHPEIPQRGIEG